MRVAVRAAIPRAFRLLDVDAIEAEVQAGNDRSLAVLRDVGMGPIGERMVFAPARGRDERCVVLEVCRPD